MIHLTLKLKWIPLIKKLQVSPSVYRGNLPNLQGLVIKIPVLIVKSQLIQLVVKLVNQNNAKSLLVLVILILRHHYPQLLLLLNMAQLCKQLRRTILMFLTLLLQPTQSLRRAAQRNNSPKT